MVSSITSGLLWTWLVSVRCVPFKRPSAHTLLSADDVVIELNGSLHLPDSISAVQNIVKAKKTIGGSWIRIKGTNVRLIGKDDPDWAYGSIWGYGEQWWKAGQKVSRAPNSHPRIPQLI